MDVREFIGGDITVRTAGPTVSVRGKMDVGTSEKNDENLRNHLSATGTSSTSKTLHRRFTLPVDADCDKVESSLSRDAVLTVTIPKKVRIYFQIFVLM